MTKSNGRTHYRRPFYQLLMTVAFSIDTDHHYDFLISKLLRFNIFNLFVSLVLASSYVIWKEKNLSVPTIMELCLCIITGILHGVFLIVFEMKKPEIASNYSFIQNDFVRWSLRSKMDPDKVYKQIAMIITKLSGPTVILYGFLFFGPLLAAFNDLGKLPLNDRSHFLLYWPEFITMDKFSTYGIVYVMQLISSAVIIISILGYNLGFMVILLETSDQFEKLMCEIKNAFDRRMEHDFENIFIDCIKHHQLIIKFFEDFKSYYRWVIITEMTILQGVFAITIYDLIKVDAAIGFKLKVVSVVLLNVILFFFHCHIGEIMLSKHKHLSEHMYDMSWYDMPSKHRQNIVIMLQRTQRDLTLNSPLSPGEKASRSLLSKVVKQVYTLLNVLLKT